MTKTSKARFIKKYGFELIKIIIPEAFDFVYSKNYEMMKENYILFNIQSKNNLIIDQYINVSDCNTKKQIITRIINSIK